MTNDEKQKAHLQEFIKYSDFFLVRLNCSKGELAQKLGISQDYFSKLYNGVRPVSTTILEKFIQISQEQNSPKISHPDKFAIQENLPSIPNQAREDAIAKKELDGLSVIVLKDLVERVAALEKDRATKDDSEKKIRGIVNEAIRDEVERISEELSNRSTGRREAANG